MTDADPWTIVANAQMVRLELAPSGLRGFHRTALAATGLAVAMVLPMALIGGFGAWAWDDFATALRVAMGLGSTIAIALAIWLPSRLLVSAFARRARIRVTAAGVLVEIGSRRPAQTLWLTPVDAVSVALAPPDDLGRGGVQLSAGDARIRVGAGHPTPAMARLVAVLRDAISAPPTDPTARPSAEDLGPPWRRRLRRLLVDMAGPLRRPTPFILVDLGAIVGVPILWSLSTWVLADLLSWRDVYPVAFGLFVAGLAARRFDRSYLQGLRRYARPTTNGGAAYVMAAIAIAIAGWIGMAPRLGIGLSALLALPIPIALHVGLLRRARRDEALPAPARRLDLTLAATLVPLSLLHEAAMFEFIVDASASLGPLPLTFVPVTALVAYWPVRLHALVDEPDDRANVAWFWLTVAWLSLQPLLAMGPAIAAEL